VIQNFQGFDGRARGGVGIFIHKACPFSIIKLNTTLQAVAIRITLHKVITICSLYIPPTSNCDLNALDNLLHQLSSPVLMLGDYNAHSPIWGWRNQDHRGRLIEDFIANNNLYLLTDTSHTYLHPATGSSSAIDLSLCSASITPQFTWAVHDDLCGSDHYPLIVKLTKPTPNDVDIKWKLSKANWTDFQQLCTEKLTVLWYISSQKP